MTSGNLSDEPISFDDADAHNRLRAIADAVLTHDRRIHRRADDSVVRRLGASMTVMRRARGFVPNAFTLSAADNDNGVPSVLGVGAELKSTVCITRGHQAFMSTHLGDLEHPEAFRSFGEAIGDLQRFLGVQPVLVAHDLHPEYLSAKWAGEQGLDTLGVQHHHAHIASCLAEHGRHGPVVGIVFDGHGYGPDSTLWGGEFLVADLSAFERMGHLRTVAVPGGATAIRQPWRMAAAHLREAYGDATIPELAVRNRNAGSWEDVTAVAGLPTTVRSSSMGRLFDAAAAIIGIRDRCSFEGQAAMELEQAAFAAPGCPPGAETSLDRMTVERREGMLVLDPAPLLRSLSERVHSGAGSVAELALLVHHRIADATVRAAQEICEVTGLHTVVLSGGVFQNALLTDKVVHGLAHAGLDVLTHRRVPPNDGGISLGQVAIARAVLAGRQ